MKTEVIQVHSEFPDLKVIDRCVKVIKKGGLVIFPTETVYGIAADFSNPKAVRRLREVKRRADDKPFSVLIPGPEALSCYTSITQPTLYKLIERFWPGPLTVVVPAKKEGTTIGLRVPNHPVAFRLILESGRPIAAPSANIEGVPPPSTCAEALKDLDGLVEIALDSGKVDFGQASTVVDLSDGNPVVLREGVITREEIEKVAAQKTILFVCTGNSCRSVMAEYLLKDRVKHRDDIEVLSAGTSVFLHSRASRDTLAILRGEGLDASEHCSRPMDRSLLKKADLILVMTADHRLQVLALAPEVEQRIYLLREFANETVKDPVDLDIPDPMGNSSFSYETCFAMIKEAVGKIEKLI